MTSDLEKSCWNSLLLLAESVKKARTSIDYCSFRFGADEAVKINSIIDSHPHSYSIILDLTGKIKPSKNLTDSQHAWYKLSDMIHVREMQPSTLPQTAKQLIEMYAPYCFVSAYARSLKTAFSIAHFAQSLDGRIATSSGDSKWIGSHGNLVHTHRMRALCDGVLIGSRTLKRDHPQLTVRLVEGNNPTRIIIGSTADDLESLIQASQDPIVIIGTKSKVRDKNALSLELKKKTGFIPTSQILKTLFENDIHSVYIEGGAVTTSHFLADDNVNILQLHISPMMLGSGMSSIHLPPVQNISSSIRFQSHQFLPVDDGIMFVGSVIDIKGIMEK